MNELLDIVFRSIWVSGSATLLSSTWSIPLAYHISRNGKAKHLVVPVLEALVGIPTILIGLLIYLLACSRCPMGFTGLLYTPQAIIIGESILITPLIVAVAHRVFEKNIESYGELVLSLGGSGRQAFNAVLHESIPGLIACIVMGFSRAVGEIGVAMVVGGNIKGYTRVITTAIALLVSRGELEEAVILGSILVLIVVAVSIATRLLERLM